MARVDSPLGPRLTEEPLPLLCSQEAGAMLKFMMNICIVHVQVTRCINVYQLISSSLLSVPQIVLPIL